MLLLFAYLYNLTLALTDLTLLGILCPQQPKVRGDGRRF